MLTNIVNSDHNGIEGILKYFEKGHSCMADDAVHGDFKNQMRKIGKIYDFRNFCDCIKQAGYEPI